MGAVFISIETGTWIIFFFAAWWRDCLSLLLRNSTCQAKFGKLPPISRNFRQLVVSMGAVFISIEAGTWIIFFFVAWWRDYISLAQLELST